MNKILIANRGEIAVRICRAATDAGLQTVAVYSADDADGLHVRLADEAVSLQGAGPRAYLDIDAVIAAAQSTKADGIHPGYGFLSENADFAAAVEAAGITFIGPESETLRVFGDKLQARAEACACGIPVLAASSPDTTLQQAADFLQSAGGGNGMLIKAVAGGGGRGMRHVTTAGELEQAWPIASSEAAAAFGDGQLYVEEYLPSARHIEVQIVGDGTGDVIHVGERECTLQRRYQKLVEIAPSPGLSQTMRDALTTAAVALGQRVQYRGLGTVEFLVSNVEERFVFIEVNPRLQVEHTVTEEAHGVDLVGLQLEIAAGRSLLDLALTSAVANSPRGFAIQVRLNTETMDEQGKAKPASGTLRSFEPPSGPGIRTDTHGYVGYNTLPAFDSLLAKLIVRCSAQSFERAVQRTARALTEFRIEGIPTNRDFLLQLLQDARVAANDVHTRFIDDHAAELCRNATVEDPLAVLNQSAASRSSVLDAPLAVESAIEVPDGSQLVTSTMPGTVVSVDVAAGDLVSAGQTLLIIEAMKMQHVVSADVGGIVQRVLVNPGETIHDGHSMLLIEVSETATDQSAAVQVQDLDEIRADLQEVYDRKSAGLDVNRPEAVARRHKKGHRTARENIADLCDDGTFVEYGSGVLAAQRRRRSMEDLIANTSGDGMVCGLGQINGQFFPPEKNRAMLVSYDYMVLAGTQGMMNHYKKDRMFEIAEKQQLPVVLFAEGGGGRPGDTDAPGVAGLDCLAFNYFAKLSALVPLIGIANGRCFAGNAVLLGCCDVIIATDGANIGVGGPAMIEGGGLGVYRPEQVGPMDVQVPNGVVDIAVKDEAEAVAAARKYLAYFQGAIESWEAPDERELRFIVPENRLRYYDMKSVLYGIADVDSVLELRPQWGIGIITAFIRVEGRPVGVIANNPGHLAGAIDAEGADKAARFMQLCDAFDIPILSLCDCPGIMVGPEVEKTAVVRHAARLFVVGANIDVPLMSMITRKGYGLGVMAMAGGSFKAPLFTVTWPTGEFGGMGLEGAVKLGYRKELEAIEDPAERQATYEKMVAKMYEHGKAVNMASHFELDEVIDPADSRHWIITALNSVPPVPPRRNKKRRNVDTW